MNVDDVVNELLIIRRRRGDYRGIFNLYKTVASRHFVNLFLLLYSPVGEYKGMSRHIGPITTSDFLCSRV